LGSQPRLGQSKEEVRQKQIKAKKKHEHTRGVKRKHSWDFQDELPMWELGVLKCLKNLRQNYKR